MTYRKKLIEVALPLDAINAASAREKSIRHGHPSTLHLWWARRPLAACRAVLFASLVDDPSEHPEQFPSEQAQEQERQRLFRLIEELVKWENSNNESVLQQARAEILKSTGGNPPPVLDPFAGGGSIPLEAQRLGLEAHASDLNPVAVLINKALIEIPPKFAGQAPVNPEARKSLMGGDWSGARGLADDIRYYGKWMRDEAEKRIGHLYPKVTLPKEYGGGEATVIAWLWTRTVTCPNPACGGQLPLAGSFWLSKRKGQEAWVEPIINHEQFPPKMRFVVKVGQGTPPLPPKVGRGAQFKCPFCSNIVDERHVKNEGLAKRLGIQLMAIVAEGKKGRIYLSPLPGHERSNEQLIPQWKPEQELADDKRAITCPLYGLTTFGDLFTSRQLVALNTFNEMVQEIKEKVLSDANKAGLVFDEKSLNDGGLKANAYADAVAVYLAFAISKAADLASSLCHWQPNPEHLKIAPTFSRHALPMVWDFAEGNPFSESSGNFGRQSELIEKAVINLPSSRFSTATQHDATAISFSDVQPIISMDPPYYDNIGYADLSDFFYIWLRRSLQDIYPDLFRTMLVPKAQELVAVPYRFGGSKNKAQEFFETGLRKAFEKMRAIQQPSYPLTVYYAFKQMESEADEHVDDQLLGIKNGAKAIASTGWETMLESLILSGFTITGTWPMHTERTGRMRDFSSNALASSIVLVCRSRHADAPVASRRQFLNALRTELPAALKNLQHGSIAPVDLAQASIGPGMAIYSRYSKVVESDGTPLRVRTALQLINRALDEALAEQEGEYDAETRWAVAWFEQFAMNAGEYGMAETLSKAKNTSVQSLVDAGLLEARAGKVRLLKREELATKWDPKASRLTVWEVMQRMIHELLDGKGDSGAGDILRQASAQGEVARDLAYRLYTVCERKGWAQEALAYNSLVTSWSEISRLAHREPEGIRQATFLG
jgi:putative DNA methylase